MKDPAYIPAVAKEVVKLVRATHGHTAVLFTSYKALNAVYDLVKDELNEYPLIKMSRSNKNAISQFKESGNGVLFASGSMWEGVDCAGDILSSVIIVRLPFPLRTQAMELKKRACTSTGEFVQRYAVPQMIIKLRQGAGRLIRSETDTGILAILDARAAQDGAYRNRVLKALGKYPLVSSIEEVASFIDSVKDAAYSVEQNASAIWKPKEQRMQKRTRIRHRPEMDCAKVELWKNLCKKKIRRSGNSVFGFLQVSDDE